MRVRSSALLLAFFAIAVAFPASSQTLPEAPPAHMMQMPDVHGDAVTFCSEGDIWVGSISKGFAYRLTNDSGQESNPYFSPDGKTIAFTGQYDGGSDVYIIPVEGGTPKRLTWEPFGATVEGWTEDGKEVLFRSRKTTPLEGVRIYEVPIAGGIPTPLPMPKAAEISFAPGGSALAFVRLPMEEHHWKRYHGGQANNIWIYRPKDDSYKRIDDLVINEQYPVWTRAGLYYVSEADGSANLWKYNPANGQRSIVTHHAHLDVRYPASDGKTIVYEYGYRLWQYNIATGKDAPLHFQMATDRIHARPQQVAVKPAEFSLGPTGARLVVQSQGQLFSFATKPAVAYPIAPSLSSMANDPVWSPDGKSIAFISDLNGEQNVWIAPSDGTGTPKMLTHISHMPLSGLVWAPDSKHIAYSDYAQKLWVVDTSGGEPEQVSESQYGGFSGYSFSPDSTWIAFSRQDNFFTSDIYLFNLATKRTITVTDGPYRDAEPVFDPSGKYLMFSSHRSVVVTPDEFDFNGDIQDSQVVMLVTLAAATPSPMALKPVEEGVAKKPEAKPEDKDGKPAATVIDASGIQSRIMELPLPPGTYTSLQPGDGHLFVLSSDETPPSLISLDLATGKPATIAENVASYDLSADGDMVAVNQGGSISVGPSDDPLPPTTPKVDFSQIMETIDPAKQWNEIFTQAWRTERDVFYDPNMHDRPWDAIRARYAALLPAVGSRDELNEIIGQMIGEVNVSHSFVFGGHDRVAVTKAPTPGPSSLGVDMVYDATAHAYRITKIYGGDGFDFAERSPLLEPGINAHAGSLIFAINNQPAAAQIDPDELLYGLAGKITAVTIGDSEAKKTTVFVKPLASDSNARYYAWVQANRDAVMAATHGTVGYVHIRDMENAGFAEMSKWLYDQIGKDGLIIDVRYNPGGDIDSQVIDRLRRFVFEYDQGRYGAPMPNHPYGFRGKLVLMCNEESSSDAEYVSQLFEDLHLGKTVGTRTWGGFMATYPVSLVDGGMVIFPGEGSFTPQGKWLPDGTGFTPDIQVPEDPHAMEHGVDNQLQVAIETIEKEIAADPVKPIGRLQPPSAAKAFPPNKK